MRRAYQSPARFSQAYLAADLTVECGWCTPGVGDVWPDPEAEFYDYAAVQRLGWVAMGIYAIGVPLGYMVLLITIYPELRARQAKRAAEKAQRETLEGLAAASASSSSHRLFAKLGRSFKSKSSKSSTSLKSPCSSLDGASATSRSGWRGVSAPRGDSSRGDSSLGDSSRGETAHGESFAAFSKRDGRCLSSGRSTAAARSTASKAFSTDRRVQFSSNGRLAQLRGQPSPPASPPDAPPPGDASFVEPSFSLIPHADALPTPVHAALPKQRKGTRLRSNRGGNRGSAVQFARERGVKLAQARAAVSVHLHLMEALEFLWEDYEVGPLAKALPDPPRKRGLPPSWPLP